MKSTSKNYQVYKLLGIIIIRDLFRIKVTANLPYTPVNVEAGYNTLDRECISDSQGSAPAKGSSGGKRELCFKGKYNGSMTQNSSDNGMPFGLEWLLFISLCRIDRFERFLQMKGSM